MPCHTELSSRLLSSCRRRAAAWFVLLAPEKNIYFFCCPLAFFFLALAFGMVLARLSLDEPTNQSARLLPPSSDGAKGTIGAFLLKVAKASQGRKEGKKSHLAKAKASRGRRYYWVFSIHPLPVRTQLWRGRTCTSPQTCGEFMAKFLSTFNTGR